MKRINAPIANYRWICGSLLALLLAALPAAAAPTGQVAEVENRGGKLVFYPVLEEFDRIILTVTGPCNYEYREVIKPGQVGVFRLSPETIDDIYTFQLVAMPVVGREILEILYDARKNDDNTRVNALCREGALPGDPLTQADGFRVFRGEIIYDPEAVEEQRLAEKAPAGNPIPLKDFVINDDLIVDGSACIGFDCVNGESFGFDTIRLKENNLRIKFDDTSVAASYPRTDWQLTANSSANGGASKFSIDDISGSRTPFTVEANARSHSLYVDDGGRIGNRTSTPSTEIHTIDGDTPTLRLQQDGSSGFAPQTWDVAGNETNFFIRDVTNGSTLPFRIRPSAPTSSIFIDTDGDVGLGTSSPGHQLHVVETTAGGKDMLNLENNGPSRFLLTNTADNTLWRFNNAGGGTLRIAEDSDMAAETEFELEANGDLTITGQLVTDGGTCGGGCDLVFQPGYDLETIEEHAEQMWRNSYLPAVGPTVENAPVNLSERTGSILNELEKAHIYIEQLHNRLSKKETELSSVLDRLHQIERLLAAESAP